MSVDSFKRPELNKLLQHIIPDLQYIPTEIFCDLLELPWADIFTTNYDTLLERTLSDLSLRHYDVVYTQDDISLKNQPRIVKLHGSFPSYTPFIITKDDFENYKDNFGAYTNFVQQSIMENTLCLLGYSGNDTNFKKWIHWVNETLNEAMRPVYLIGSLELSEDRIQELRSQKIIPIDLKPILNIRGINTNYHQNSVNLFIELMSYGKPLSLSYWPISEKDRIKPIYKILLDQSNLINITEGQNQLENKADEQIRSWRKDREDYPGWAICPLKSLHQVYFSLYQNSNFIVNYISHLSSELQLYYLYELVWRTNIALLPLDEEIIPIVKTVINDYYPFLSSNDKKIADKENIDNSEINIDFDKTRELWIYISLSLLRHYREKNDDENYSILVKEIKEIISKDDLLLNFFYNELCISALNKLDYDLLNIYLEEWSISSNFPFFYLYKAKYHIEICHYKTAEELINKSETEIRSHINRTSEPFTYLSQEGWLIFLNKFLTKFCNYRTKEKIDKDNERLIFLRDYGCNPVDIINDYLNDVRNFLTNNDSKLESEPFDLFVRREFISNSFSSNIFKEKDIIAYKWFRLLEEIPIPCKCGYYTFEKKTTLDLFPYLKDSYLQVFLYYIKFGCNSDEINITWSDIVSLDKKTVLSTYEILINSINNSIIIYEFLFDKPRENYGHIINILKIAPELLSRLSIHLEEFQINEVIEIYIKLLQSKKIQQDESITQNHKDIFPRILDSASDSIIIEKMPQLINLPVPGIGHFSDIDEKKWNEPFNDISWIQYRNISQKSITDEWNESIDRLLNNMVDSTDVSRYYLLLRLSLLIQGRCISDFVKESIIESLNILINDSKIEDPRASRLIQNVLNLINPELGRNSNVISEYLDKFEFPRTITRTNNGVTSTSGLGNFSYELLNFQNTGYVYSNEEIEKILQKFISFWDSEKEWLINKDTLIISLSFKTIMDYALEVLERIVLPRITSTSKQFINEVNRIIIIEFPKYDIDNLKYLPYMAAILPDQMDFVTKKLRQSINSNQIEIIKSSISSIINWIQIYQMKDKLEDLEEILNIYFEIFEFRIITPLKECLKWLPYLLKNYPSVFTDKRIKVILDAIDYFIDFTDYLKGTIKSGKEKVEYRLICSQIVSIIRISYYANDYSKEPILEKYHKIFGSDLIPVVRRSWNIKEI
ncbi:SIR2 family protein [uncultured Methanospirillum sp.]|uniref:SIR2 family NAD-dependent protein deacylase n=1 Tax=uncultured Methanospirillum sp. TaxID=262503 RepID=UPI0029C6A1C5|nr:SIR2 family protein [uncultured Methanospirillum sp.]